MPRPLRSVRSRSASSSAGSPKNASPPSRSSDSSAALDGGHRLRADQAVLRGDLLAIVGDEAEQGAQVVEVEQQQALVVGQLERDLEDAGLGVVELEHPRPAGVGPISLTVVRTGWPAVPYRSQNTTGLASGA